MSVETGDLVKRIYGGFRGVDFRGDETNIIRSPDSVNVWKDYKEIDSIRTRPEMEKKLAFTAPVYGIFSYKGMTLIHSGTVLYKVVNGVKTQLYTGLRAGKSDSFVWENIWYFKDGKHYLQYDGTTISEVVGYVPTTSIGRKPEGGGTVYEDVNMLNGQRKNTFLADGGSFDFYLDAQNIDSDFPPIVKVNDVVQSSGYTVSYTEGKISFTQAPDAPLTDGQDNVSVEFRKTIQVYRDTILECTLLQVFDNRVFFSGNEDYPNVLWHCSLNDPTYVSDLDFYREGLDNARITGMAPGNNGLWVFREPSNENTTVFYHTPTLDADYGKIYPSTHSSITTGCIGKAINFNGDILFFSDRGMEGTTDNIETQAVYHRSSLVDRKMLQEPEYKNMILAEWEGYLLCFMGNHVYLADSRAMFTNENHAEYEWFYWELPKAVTYTQVIDGTLYLGADDGLYTLTDFTSDVEAWWVTPKDKFNAPQKLKSSHKRGCVAEATGDITVYAKLEDTDFEHIGDYTGVTDYFVSRIKRKKFKDIQLKFYSQSRFSLETVTFECFVGGYIKR